jgi:anti-sigma B factor antagonist
VDVRLRVVDSAVVLDLSGRFVLGDGEGRLRSVVERCLREGHARILLNCTDLSYVDSSGLGEVVEAYVAVTGAGGRLVLVGVTRRFRLLLATVGLLGVLEVCDDEGHGLDRLRGAESQQPRRCQGAVLLSA